MKVLIQSALQSEVSRVIQKLQFKEIFKKKRIRIYNKKINNDNIYFGISGVGTNNAIKFIKTFNEVIGKEPDIILSTGYAGSLKQNLKPGNVVCANEYFCGNIITKLTTLSKDAKLMLNICRGVGVNTIADKEMKYEIIRKFPDSGFVDMETCGIINSVDINRTKIIVLRSISDGLNFQFPDFKFIRDSYKKTNIFKLIRYAFKNYDNFKKVFLLSYGIKKARKSLYRILKYFIEKRLWQ